MINDINKDYERYVNGNLTYEDFKKNMVIIL